MGATLEESYGRTRHDIELLGNLLSMPNNNTFGNDNVNKGWAKQRDKTIKTLLSNIFRKSTKGQVIKARGCRCTVITPTGSLNIPEGYVTDMYFGTFPFVTSVILYTRFGQAQQFYNLGNEDFT